MKKAVALAVIIIIATAAIAIVSGCGKQASTDAATTPAFGVKPEETEGENNTTPRPLSNVVYFVCEGKTLEIVKCADMENIKYPSAPEKRGYTVKWSEEAEKLAEGKYKITAEYTAVNYELTFSIDGKKYKISYNVEMGEIRAPEIEMPLGYEAEWGELEFDYADREYEGEMKLKKYKVKYESEGRTVKEMTVDIINYKELIPAVPEKEGYTGKWEDVELPADNREKVIIKAEYTAKEYTATFKADGEAVAKVKFTVEGEIQEPKVPERKHYNGKWGEYEIRAEDIEIEAEYKAKEYTLTYTADGEKVGERKYTVESNKSEISEPEVPKKAGYRGKWEEYEISDGGDREIKAEYEKEDSGSESGNKYEYELNTDGTWSIVRYNGSEEKEVEIPKEYGGRAVTKVNNAAFSYKEEIEVVIVPENVKEIERAAFIGCRNIKRIEVRNNDCKVHALAIHDCGGAEIIINGGSEVAVCIIENRKDTL